MGLLGKYPGQRFPVEKYPCGEKPLIASIEGKRGTPCRGLPFLPNQVFGESLPSSTMWKRSQALRPSSSMEVNGTVKQNAKSAGTKGVCAGGKSPLLGLIEVPMGTTLREIIFDIGGACMQAGRRIQAAINGRPFGRLHTNRTPRRKDGL